MRRSVTLAGVGLISFSSIALELLVTRIFSVTLHYHYAFMVVSLAMLGISAGGLWAFLAPAAAAPEAEERRLAGAAIGFGVSAVAATLLHLFLPHGLLPMALYLLVNFVAFAVPFTFVGAFLALVFRADAARIGTLYMVDLVGAALGAATAALVLGPLSAPSAVLLMAAIGVLPAALLRARRGWGLVVVGVLVAGLVSDQAHPWMRAHWVKGNEVREDVVELDLWNAYSNVRVLAHERIGFPGWGNRHRATDRPALHRHVEIDADAGTWIMRDGARADLSYLETDLTNLAYQVRTPDTALVIGVGGGRDLLSGLRFGVRRIVGVEINPLFKELLEGPFREYSGNLLGHPQVEFVVDDGRAFLEASEDHFDLIQLSLVDTWAASSAGAYILTENSLYTVEAFRTYFRHLSDSGILSMARFSFTPPSQLLRLVTTARAAAEELGIEDFSRRIVVVRMTHENNESAGVVLYKADGYSPAETERIMAFCQELGLEAVWVPGVPLEGTPIRVIFQEFLSARSLQPLLDSYPYDVSPSTDDRPFFFLMVHFSDVVGDWFGYGSKWRSSLFSEVNFKTVSVLFQLLGAVLLLTVVVILFPLFLVSRRRRQRIEGIGPELGYFAALGVGFMMMEVPLIQRFSVFLGHPVLSLAVVLVSVLFFSGIGSYLAGRVPEASLTRWARVLLSAIVFLAVITALGLDPVLDATRHWSLEGRIALTICLLAPVAVPMGTAFPLGVRHLGGRGVDRIPWYWGVNGACSVFGSVFVMVVALFMGFWTGLLLGAASYLLALLVLELRRSRGVPCHEESPCVPAERQ